MADEGLVEDSGEASPDTQVAEPTEAVQQDSDTGSDAAPDGTPADDGSAEIQQTDATDKRVNDTLAALKDAQRELHETKGQLKEIHTRVEAARQPQFDPKELRQQLEDDADRLGMTPEALEHFENRMYGQELAFQKRLQEQNSQYRAELDKLNPVVQKHQGLVDELSNDPMFQGWSPTQIAQVAEVFTGKRGGKGQPTPPKPPASGPAGTGRRSQSSTPKDGFTDVQRAWINADVDGEEQSTGLIEGAG